MAQNPLHILRITLRTFTLHKITEKSVTIFKFNRTVDKCFSVFNLHISVFCDIMNHCVKIFVAHNRRVFFFKIFCFWYIFIEICNFRRNINFFAVFQMIFLQPIFSNFNRFKLRSATTDNSAITESFNYFSVFILHFYKVLVE